MAEMKTCRRGHVHDGARCRECSRIGWRRQYRHKMHGDAPPRVPLRLATHCPRGHSLAGSGLRYDGGKAKCRECANATRREQRAALSAAKKPAPEPARAPRQRAHPELSDVPVVVHRRERPATRDPWSALLFGGVP